MNDLTIQRVKQIQAGGQATAEEQRSLATLALRELKRKQAPIEEGDLSDFELQRLRRVVRNQKQSSWAVVIGSQRPPTDSTDVWVIGVDEPICSSGPVTRASDGRRFAEQAIGITQPTRQQARLLRKRLLEQSGLRKRTVWDHYNNWD